MSHFQTCCCSLDDCRVNGCMAMRRANSAPPYPPTQTWPTVTPFPNFGPITYTPPPERKPWTCPVCGAGMAPHVDRCACRDAKA